MQHVCYIYIYTCSFARTEKCCCSVDSTVVYVYINVFNPKSRWQPPQRHPCLEVFLSPVENELFELPKVDIKYSNLSREEWNAIKSLADDRNIVIKKADKGSCIVIWGQELLLNGSRKKLSDKKVCQEASNSENILTKLAEMSDKMFSSLKKRGYITEKQLLNIFRMNIEKPQSLVKFMFFPKFIKGSVMSQDN